MSGAMTDGSLIFDPLCNTDLNFPAELVMACAQGLEEPDVIAPRYGYEGDRWERLKSWKPFLDTVAKARSQLEAEGWTIKAKARLMAELLQDEMCKKALSADASIGQQLDVYRELVKTADLIPKKEATVQPGTGFSITINLDRQASIESVKRPVNSMPVIDVQAKEIPE